MLYKKGDCDDTRSPLFSGVNRPMTTRECPLDLMIADGTLPVEVEGRYELRAPLWEPEQE